MQCPLCPSFVLQSHIQFSSNVGSGLYHKLKQVSCGNENIHEIIWFRKEVNDDQCKSVIDLAPIQAITLGVGKIQPCFYISLKFDDTPINMEEQTAGLAQLVLATDKFQGSRRGQLPLCLPRPQNPTTALSPFDYIHSSNRSGSGTTTSSLTGFFRRSSSTLSFPLAKIFWSLSFSFSRSPVNTKERQ